MFKFILPTLLSLMWLSPASADTDQAALDKVSVYLNNLSTLKAHFLQIAPDGSTSEGEFYLQRPGKMRWEYAPPTPVLMVSTGKMMTYYDSDLDQISHIPIDNSLAGFLTQDTISFAPKVIEVLNAEEKDGVIQLHIRQKEKPEEGELVMEFTTAPMQLVKLITKDSSAQDTHIALSQLKMGMKLDKELFKPPHKSVFDHGH